MCRYTHTHTHHKADIEFTILKTDHITCLSRRAQTGVVRKDRRTHHHPGRDRGGLVKVQGGGDARGLGGPIRMDLKTGSWVAINNQSGSQATFYFLFERQGGNSRDLLGILISVQTSLGRRMSRYWNPFVLTELLCEFTGFGFVLNHSQNVVILWNVMNVYFVECFFLIFFYFILCSYFYVHMFICVCVFMSVFLSVWMFVCVCLSLGLSTSKYMCMGVHVHLFQCVPVGPSLSFRAYLWFKSRSGLCVTDSNPARRKKTLNKPTKKQTHVIASCSVWGLSILYLQTL